MKKELEIETENENGAGWSYWSQKKIKISRTISSVRAEYKKLFGENQILYQEQTSCIESTQQHSHQLKTTNLAIKNSHLK